MKSLAILGQRLRFGGAYAKSFNVVCVSAGMCPRIFVEIDGSWFGVDGLIEVHGGLTAEFWRELDGCRLRYRRKPIRFRVGDPYWILLAEYVDGDGDLTGEAGIRFYDEERETVELLRKAVSQYTEYELPNPFYWTNQYGRGEWAVQTRHSALHFVLNKFYQIPVGKKKRTFTISPRVKTSNSLEEKYAAVAGWISSEGYVNYRQAHGRFSTIIGVVSTVNEERAKAIHSTLQSLGYHPYVTSSTYPNPFTGKPVTQFTTAIRRHNEVISLFFHMFPYMVKPSRVRKWMALLREEAFYRRIRLWSKALPELLRKGAIAMSGSRYRYLHIIEQLAEKYGIVVERWGGVKHWTRCDEHTSIPLPIVAECCRILREDLFNYIPQEFAPVLWTQAVINYNELVKLRETTPLINLSEMLRSL